MKEFNLDYFKNELRNSDLLALEYLKEYIPEELESLYYEIMNYNEIYGNGWTIEDLLKMGEKDSYWKERAKKFIKEYKITKKNYGNYTKYFEEYTIKRDLLFEKLGLNLKELY